MEITKGFFMQSLREAAKYGARIALEEAGINKAKISKRAAVKKYGLARVNKMIEMGLIKPQQLGDNTSPYLIDKSELESAAMALNVHY